MSWDIWAKTKDVDGNEHEVAEWNHTHNCNRMIREAGLTEWSADWIKMADSRQIASRLGDVLAAFAADPARFRAMEPDNKWGTLESVTEVLSEIGAVAEKHPSATWSAWF